MVSPSNGEVILEQGQLYEYCARLISSPESESSNRTISIASLHGHVGRRTIDEPSPETVLGGALQAFVVAISERICSRSEPWHVRQLLNIVSTTRLDQVGKRQLSLDGEHHEIRAIVEPGALPVFSPLIISNKHVFLALDDDRLFRAGTAVYLQGAAAVAWAQEYFNDLWVNAPWTLRDPVGNRETDIAQLRAALITVDDARAVAEQRKRRLADPQASEGGPGPHTAPPEAAQVEEAAKLISLGEGAQIEFKSSLRTSIPDRTVMKELESAVTKTVAGFLNSSEGGYLFIGVDDAGSPIGLQYDLGSSSNIKTMDGFERHLYSLLEARLGHTVSAWLSVSFPVIQGQTICQVSCRPAGEPVIDSHRGVNEFWLRTGNATKALVLSDTLRYTRLRWP